MEAANPSLLFRSNLNLPDISKLVIDPIAHDANWSDMLQILPSYIPKFKGKYVDDPTNNIISFHLRCSFNNIVEDLVDLYLFQRNLTSTTVK